MIRFVNLWLAMLFAACLFQQKANAQIGDTCVNNVTLTGDTLRLSFVAHYDSLAFTLNNIPGYGHIHSVALYSVPGKPAIDSVGLPNDTSSLPLSLNYDFLVIGQTYYILLSREVMNCSGCTASTAKFSYCMKQSNRVGNIFCLGFCASYYSYCDQQTDQCCSSLNPPHCVPLVCTGTMVSFSGGPYWSINGGPIVGQYNPYIYTFATPGSYTIHSYGYFNGAQECVPLTVTVVDGSATPTLTVTPSTFCEGDNLSIAGTLSPNICPNSGYYTISPDPNNLGDFTFFCGGVPAYPCYNFNGSICPNGQEDGMDIFPSDGTYTLTLHETTACGNVTTASQVITMNTLDPTFTVTGNCSNTITVGYTGLCPQGSNGSINFSWDFGDGSPTVIGTPNPSPPTHAYGNPGTYTITLTATNNVCNDVATYTVAVTVGAQNLAVNIVPNPLEICTNGSPGTLIANVTGGAAPYTYKWSPGGQTFQAVLVSSAGTYTVNVTDANGCTASAVATVILVGPPNETGGNVTACYGKPVQVGVVPPPPPPFFYFPWTVSWTTSGGTLSNYTSPDPLFMPPSNVNATYTLTETICNLPPVPLCCTTYTMTVTINSAPIVSISGPDVTCFPANLTNENYCPTVTNGSPPYTYNWSVVGSTSLAASTSCPPNGLQVTWPTYPQPSGGEVILDVTDANGCNGVDTFLVRGCCDVSPEDWSGDIKLSTILPPYPSGLTKSFNTFYLDHTLFGINGTLTVDEPLVIEYSRLEMGTMAKINVVGNSGSLKIEFSQLYACTDMWDGIYLNNTLAFPDLIVENSVIEDAENAIVATTNSPVFAPIYVISGSLLNNNWKGIEIGNWLNPFDGLMQNSEISCDNVDLTAEPGFPPAYLTSVTFPASYPNNVPDVLRIPHAGFRSLIGVDIADNKANIPIGNVSKNTYQDLDYGIYTRASNVSVNYDKFLSIDNSSLQNVPSPAGIIANGDPTGAYTVNVGTTAGCTFKDCFWGIAVRDTLNANIENNTIKGNPANVPFNNPIGINLLDNFRTVLNVTKNTIKHNYIEINAYSNINAIVNLGSATNPALANIISSNPAWQTNYGIRINEFITPNPAASYTVGYNNIDKVTNGIYCTDLRNYIIDFNTITITGLAPAPPVIDNEGIYMANSRNGRIINNTVNYGPHPTAADGIRLDHSSGNLIGCNTLNFTKNGNCIAFWGPQVPGTLVDLNNIKMGNPFTSNVIGIHLLNTGTNIGHQGSSSAATANTWSIYYLFTGPPWATFVDYGSNLPCFPPSARPTQFWVVPPPHYPENPNNVMNGEQLGGCAILFHSFASPDPDTCPFPPSSATGTLDTNSALGIVNDSSSFVEFTNSSIWLDKHTLYHYLTEADSSLTAVPAIKQYRDNARAGNVGKMAQIDKTFSDTNGFSNADLAQVSLQNSSMINPDTVEQLYQSVYNIVLNMFGTGVNLPDTLEQVLLKQIAPLCPAKYGTAVYLARALLSQVDTTLYYADCGAAIDKIKRQKKSESLNNSPTYSVKVYPNPANTILNVDAQILKGQIENICIYNSLGKQVRCTQLTNSRTVIPVNDLAAGIYFYRVTDQNGNLIRADKQMLVH